jgi:hypothetical protein
MFVAARLDQMLYSEITDPSTGQETSWGYGVTRIEGGLGFQPVQELVMKAVVQHNMLDNPAKESITILALQAAFHFNDVQALGHL